MTRGIELRRPWGSRTSTLVCTHGHATEVPTDAAPATCPVCDATQAAPVDLVAVLDAHVQAAHPYTEGCDCAPCTDCRAILDAHVNDALDADDDAELFCVTTDATRDDGALYHGCLSADDSDPFTPWIAAQGRPVPSAAPSRGPRVLYTLPHTATPTHRPWCVTPHLRYGWCDCMVRDDARVS